MTNEEYWTEHHDRGPKTQHLITTIHDEWEETISNAVRMYLGDEPFEHQQVHINVTDQLANYLTLHQMDYNKNGTAAVDEVDDILLARMYHFLRWQSNKYDIWVR